MDKFNFVSRGFNDLLQDVLIKGSPDTNREICKIVHTKTSREIKEIAKGYTLRYHQSLCNQGNLFWKTIGSYIETFVTCYKTANNYLAAERYWPAIHDAALCLKYTSLGYLMSLVYCGLLEDSITQQQIQQLHNVTSDDRELGLQIAGFDVDDYYTRIKAITQNTASTQAITENSKGAIPTESPSQKRLETIAEESEANYRPDIQSLQNSLRLYISNNSDGILTFTGSAKLYAYLVYKIKQRRGYASIDWESFMTILPLQKETKKNTLKKYVSDFLKGRNKSFPPGSKKVDAAIDLLV